MTCESFLPSTHFIPVVLSFPSHHFYNHLLPSFRNANHHSIPLFSVTNTFREPNTADSKVRANTHIHTHYTHMHRRIYIHTYLHTHAYIQIQIHRHTHIYLHKQGDWETYTNIHSFSHLFHKREGKKERKIDREMVDIPVHNIPQVLLQSTGAHLDILKCTSRHSHSFSSAVTNVYRSLLFRGVLIELLVNSKYFLNKRLEKWLSMIVIWRFVLLFYSTNIP